MLLSGILFAMIPPLLLQGVRAMVFLPNALAADQVAAEALHQLVEGGFSTLPGQSAPVRGLRFAAGQGASLPALWLAEDARVGFRTSDNQAVLIRLDSGSGVIRRSLAPLATACSAVPSPLTEEAIPYDAPGRTQIVAAGALFRYYNQAGGLVAPSCPPSQTIRRVEIAFVAQTGSGVFEEGQAREDALSSVAIRFP